MTNQEYEDYIRKIEILMLDLKRMEAYERKTNRWFLIALGISIIFWTWLIWDKI